MSDALLMDRKKRKSSDRAPSGGSKRDEPPTKKRRLSPPKPPRPSMRNTINMPLHDINRHLEVPFIRDDSPSPAMQSALSDAQMRCRRYFDDELVVEQPFIFKIDDESVTLYPHKLSRKLLKFGYDDEDNDEGKRTASQLLKLYNQNRSVLETYQVFCIVLLVVGYLECDFHCVWHCDVDCQLTAYHFPLCIGIRPFTVCAAHYIAGD